MKKHFFVSILCFALTLIFIGCCCSGCDFKKTSDEIQQNTQEQLLSRGTMAVGMPNIVNFRERRQMKEIYEMRDQDKFYTYTYLFAEQTGKLIFLGHSIGYGIPAATQFTNPEKYTRVHTESGNWSYAVLPQADPNGLFSPQAAEGTWVTLIDPHKGQPHVVYIEPRCIVSPFPLTEDTPRL